MFRSLMKRAGLELKTRSQAVAATWSHDDGTRSAMTSAMYKSISAALVRSGENNPMSRPEVRKKMSAAKKRYNPGLAAMLERVFEMRRNGEPTSIERAMAEALTRNKLIFHREYRVWRYSLDFALVPCRVAIECDGRGWHKPDKDARRDAALEGFGWMTFRYTQDAIERSVDSCVEDLLTRLDKLGIKPPFRR